MSEADVKLVADSLMACGGQYFSSIYVSDQGFSIYARVTSDPPYVVEVVGIHHATSVVRIISDSFSIRLGQVLDGSRKSSLSDAMRDLIDKMEWSFSDFSVGDNILVMTPVNGYLSGKVRELIIISSHGNQFTSTDAGVYKIFRYTLPLERGNVVFESVQRIK